MDEEQPQPDTMLSASGTESDGDRRHRHQLALQTLVQRFAAGGCCGKRPTLTVTDLQAAGLHPIPTVFVATIGQIVPRSGWRSMCVYVYETLVRKPFPVPQQGETVDWGEIVAAGLKEIV